MAVADVWSAHREAGCLTALEHRNSPWRDVTSMETWASRCAQCTERQLMSALVMLGPCLSRRQAGRRGDPC
jgi:hypothetical protein